MESKSDGSGTHKRLAMTRIESADALLNLGTKATRLSIMLAVLGVTLWEAFGY